MGPGGVDDDLRQLGQLLWRYRQLLEDVEYLLVVQHLVASNGLDRWLGRAADLLRQATDDLVRLDGERAVLLARLGPALGQPATASLRDLARHAPEPWGDILSDHVTAFAGQVGAVAEAATLVRSSVAGGLEGIQDLLQDLTGATGGGYDAGGRPVANLASASVLFDGQA